MTKKVFYKEYEPFREIFFDEAGDRCRDMILNYLTACELWGWNEEAPFVGLEGEIEITQEEWENLISNQDLLGIQLLIYPEEHRS